MTRSLTFLSLACFLTGLATASADAPCYEIQRVSVRRAQGPEKTTVRCSLQPGRLDTATIVGELRGAQTLHFQANDAVIQQQVDQVKGIAVPDLSNAVDYTTWWVKSHPGAESKLIRANITYAGGANKIFQDEGPEARALAIFEGLNCFRTFGN
jgi:hypothetical protein